MELFCSMYTCRQATKTGAWSLSGVSRYVWLTTPSSTHPDWSMFVFVRPRTGGWSFNPTPRVSKLPFESPKLVGRHQKIVKEILEFAKENGDSGKVSSEHFCSHESMEELGRLLEEASSSP